MKQLTVILGMQAIFSGFLVAMDSPTVQKKLNEAENTFVVSPANNSIFFQVINTVFNHERITPALIDELKRVKKEINKEHETKKDGVKRLADKVCLHAFAESEKERIDLLELQDRKNRLFVQGGALLKTIVGFGLIACACKGFYDLGTELAGTKKALPKDGLAGVGLGTMLYGGTKLIHNNIGKAIFFNNYWSGKKQVADFNANQLKLYTDEKLD
jgi:hypothetical protein